jgi:hypothetical protein
LVNKNLSESVWHVARGGELAAPGSTYVRTV